MSAELYEVERTHEAIAPSFTPEEVEAAIIEVDEGKMLAEGARKALEEYIGPRHINGQLNLF